MNSISERIDQQVEEHSKQLDKVKVEGISRAGEITFTYHLASKDPQIMEFVAQEKLVNLAIDLIEPNVALYHDQSVYKKPETKKEFPWHQDNGYTPIEPEQYLTCWIALEDATIENGCIWIMPGTHKQGLVEHVRTKTGLLCYFGKDEGIPVPLKKGGVAVFSSLLFHKSGVNVSDVVRKGYIVQYTTTDAVSKKTGEQLNGPVLARNGILAKR
jgi:phytanoyl-CoA hydroxylase